MSADESHLPASAALVAETQDEHRRCLAVVASIEACLDRAPDAEGRWLDELLAVLEPLRAALTDHFADEERGPLFTRLAVRHPRFDARLVALKAEHPRLAAGVEEAIRKAESLRGADPFDLRELKAQVQLLMARLRRHEATEYEIVVEAHWDEVGVGD